MRVQVGQFSEYKEPQSNVPEKHVGFGCCCRGVGAENPVCDVEAGQDPVVGAVLEDVASGHGGIAEAVNEDGLELAFQEVDGQ